MRRDERGEEEELRVERKGERRGEQRERCKKKTRGARARREELGCIEPLPRPSPLERVLTASTLPEKVAVFSHQKNRKRPEIPQREEVPLEQAFVAALDGGLYSDFEICFKVCACAM